jgi:hypothetical protein
VLRVVAADAVDAVDREQLVGAFDRHRGLRDGRKHVGHGRTFLEMVAAFLAAGPCPVDSGECGEDAPASRMTARPSVPAELRIRCRAARARHLPPPRYSAACRCDWA